MTPKPIVIIGSINMDLVCRVDRRPLPGETVLGRSFATIPGGKGANQAVAAAKLGGNVHMIGRVGDDDFGRQMLTGLQQHGVVTTHVSTTPNTASGVAMIVVDDSAENSIIVTPGANAAVTPTDIDAAAEVIRHAACVVMQLETPFETIEHAIGLCRKFGVYTILDPAPAAGDLPATFFAVDLLTPNEAEGRLIAGCGDDASHEAVGRALLDRGVKRVVLKMGRNGSILCERDKPSMHEPSFEVNAVDTTAAGDAFTAALAISIAEGWDRTKMLRFANAAGALACTKLGAQPSIPQLAAVTALVDSDRKC